MVLATTGPRRVPRDASDQHDNVGRTERFLSVLGGSALAVYGLDRRDAGGAMLALLGAVLVHRGATARCPVFSALGVSTAPSDSEPGYLHRDRPSGRAAAFRASDAVKVERSVVVQRPAAELFAFWKDSTNLPRFMDWLEQVEQIDTRHTRWRARGPAGTSIEWTAEVINEVPDSLIAWKSVDAADIKNAGSVHFRPEPDGTGTEVRLVFEWVPPGGRAGAMAARLLGDDPDRKVQDGLLAFKALAEAQG